MSRYLLVPIGTQVVVLRHGTGWEGFLHSYLLPFSGLALVMACLFPAMRLASSYLRVPRDMIAQVAMTQVETSRPAKFLGTMREVENIRINTEGVGVFNLPSGSDVHLSREMIERLNWSWPMLVQAAKEANVPPLSLAFLHYQEPIPHFGVVNPRNREGIFQLHDDVVAGREYFSYTGTRLTGDDFLGQARKAAKFLQKKAGGRLRFDMDPFSTVVIEAIYSYNGRTYEGYNLPSGSLKQELQRLGISVGREFTRSPYIVGRMTASEHSMYLRTKGTVNLGFYGYIPLIVKLKRLHAK